jgi:hypothetical protein
MGSKEKKKIGQFRIDVPSADLGLRAGLGPAIKIDLDTATAASTLANTTFDEIVGRFAKRIEEQAATIPSEDKSKPGT